MAESSLTWIAMGKEKLRGKVSAISLYNIIDIIDCAEFLY
jgi:hypothetical protein